MFTKNTSKEDGTEPRLNIIMLRIFEQITEKCSSYSPAKKVQICATVSKVSVIF